MKKKLALVLAAAMLSTTVLAGCGGGSKETQPAGSQAAGEETTAAAGTTTGAKTLAVQIGPDPETIDPSLNSTIDGANLILYGFETLLKFDKDSQIVPGQAEKYEVSDDGLTYTFHLRDGLKWSDGTPFTAEDFVYSFKRMADPTTAASYGYAMLCMVKGYEEASIGNLDALGVSAPDEKTFVVELATPCVYFDKLVASPTMSPVQKATIEANGDAWAVDAKTYIGNGPYKISEWVPGSYITYVKNENYWDAASITFDSIKFALMEDSNASYSAYKTGELQMIKDVPSEEIPTIRDNEDFFIDPIMGTYYLSLNNNREIFKDQRVREALSLAIDRKYVSETVTQGTYGPVKNFVGAGISDAEPGSSFEDTAINTNGAPFFNVDNYEADLQKAKDLMAEAGYPDGAGFPTIEYMTNDSAYHKPIAEYLQSAWKEIGVNMDIKIVEWSTFTPTRRNGDYDVARNGWVYDYDDPSNMLNLLETGNDNNDGKYSNPEYDALIEKARNTADKAEHYALLHEAENLALKDSAMIPVVSYNDFWLQSTKLKGTWHTPYGFWNFMYGTLE
ncbi:MAG: peptide ABC transporter substrate-binding protein [Clostridium sp.]